MSLPRNQMNLELKEICEEKIYLDRKYCRETVVWLNLLAYQSKKYEQWYNYTVGEFFWKHKWIPDKSIANTIQFDVMKYESESLKFGTKYIIEMK